MPTFYFKKNKDTKRFIRKIFSKNPDKYQVYEFGEQCAFCNKKSTEGRKFLNRDSKLFTFICSKCLKVLMKKYPKFTDKLDAKRKRKEDKNRAALQLKEAEENRAKLPKKDSTIPSDDIPKNRLPISELLQGERGKRIYDYFVCNRCGKQCSLGWIYSHNIKLCNNCKTIIKFKPYTTIFYTPMGNKR